ncbi:MAG TPA: PadR family transcriptional regulator [Spirochaetota bacterium]|nr:PadR family transcriptional regulator [Spirochaetota bacterium]
MAITHAILASLVGDKPCSGYDLAKQFNSSLGFFWKASHQQIYRELARMERTGLVVSEVVQQEDRPHKKNYRVTDEGTQYLVEWIAGPTEPSPVKEDLLAKFHVGYLVPIHIIIDEILRRRKIHEEKLNVYREREREYFPDVEQMSMKAKFRYLNLRRGITHEASWISWFDEALALLGNAADE